jgi:hypothetical protein
MPPSFYNKTARRQTAGPERFFGAAGFPDGTLKLKVPMSEGV